MAPYVSYTFLLCLPTGPASKGMLDNTLDIAWPVVGWPEGCAYRSEMQVQISLGWGSLETRPSGFTEKYHDPSSIWGKIQELPTGTPSLSLMLWTGFICTQWEMHFSFQKKWKIRALPSRMMFPLSYQFFFCFFLWLYAYLDIGITQGRREKKHCLPDNLLRVSWQVALWHGQAKYVLRARSGTHDHSIQPVGYL